MYVCVSVRVCEYVRVSICICVGGGGCAHPGGTAIPREPPDDPIALQTDPTASIDR